MANCNRLLTCTGSPVPGFKSQCLRHYLPWVLPPLAGFHFVQKSQCLRHIFCYNSDMKNSKTITSIYKQEFKIEKSGLYALEITASCEKKSDLCVEINHDVFRESNPAKNIQKFNIPAAWNGSKLKGKTQTNIFVIRLTEKENFLTFIPNHKAEIIDFKYYLVDSKKPIFNLNKKTDKRNCQPFVNFILVNLPLLSLTAEVTANWHFLDGDDVKLIVDDQTITDNKTDFLWHAISQNQIKRFLKVDTSRSPKTIIANLPTGTHYLEFIADQTPTLKQVIFDFNETHSNLGMYVGDFKCVTIRKDIPEKNNKALLGIYVKGCNKTFAPSNDKYELYFNGQRVPVGEDYKRLEGIIKIAIDLSATQDLDKDQNGQEVLRYFGIDKTFWLKRDILHRGDWKKNYLWTIYEKE